jgi:hypothetical protein
MLCVLPLPFLARLDLFDLDLHNEGTAAAAIGVVRAVVVNAAEVAFR